MEKQTSPVGKIVNLLPDDGATRQTAGHFRANPSTVTSLKEFRKQHPARSVFGYSPEAAVHHFLQHQSSKPAAHVHVAESGGARAHKSASEQRFPRFSLAHHLPKERRGGKVAVAAAEGWMQRRWVGWWWWWWVGGVVVVAVAVEAVGGVGGAVGSSSERIKETISSDNKEDQRTSKATGKRRRRAGWWADKPNPERLPTCCEVFLLLFCLFSF